MPYGFECKIDIVEDISVDDFKRQYLIPQKPLLIKGGIIKKTEAYRKWSIDFFKKEMGNIEVDIYDNAVIKSKTTALTSGDLKMKFADFLNIVEKKSRQLCECFCLTVLNTNPN